MDALLGTCNPGCSFNAYCVNSTEKDQTCICHEGFEGNGYVCIGNFQKHF